MDLRRLNADLEFVKGLAAEVTAVALKRALTVTPQEKANMTFVTDLDHDLEKLLRERLGNQYPDDVLTGEEYANSGGNGPRRWSIDPIDGTGNLVHALPLWSVSIGLMDEGEPVLGVIAIPPLGETFWAIKGGGAYRDGERIHATDADVLHEQDNICLGTNAMRAVNLRSFAGRLRDLGSACCELSFVSCSRLQAATFLGEQTHDIAAGCVIAREAGCHFATIDGRPLTAAEFANETPVGVPTFIAPPKRLAALLKTAKRV